MGDNIKIVVEEVSCGLISTDPLNNPVALGKGCHSRGKFFASYATVSLWEEIPCHFTISKIQEALKGAAYLQ
jgi:hypothetical protein